MKTMTEAEKRQWYIGYAQAMRELVIARNLPAEHISEFRLFALKKLEKAEAYLRVDASLAEAAAVTDTPNFATEAGQEPNQGDNLMELIGVGEAELTVLRWKLEALQATQREYREAQNACSHQLHYEDVFRDYRPRLDRLQEELQLSVEALLASSSTHKHLGK